MKNLPFRIVEYFLLTVFLSIVAVFLIQYGNYRYSGEYIDAQRADAFRFNDTRAPDVKKVPFFSFTVAGDYGQTAETGKVLSLIRAVNPSFHIAVGDMIYKESVKSEIGWCAFVKNIVGNIPFMLIGGNHDITDGNYSTLLSCMPNRMSKNVYLMGEYGKQYYFDYPGETPFARLMLISPDLEYKSTDKNEFKKGDKKYLWLKERFLTPKNKKYSWVIVFMHKPCLSIGQKQCESGPDLSNLLISEKADLVIMGHDHFYARTHPLKCLEPNNFKTECVSRDTDISSSTEIIKSGSGTVFLTVGTGGQTGLRDINVNDPEFPYFKKYISSKTENNSHGVAKITASEDELKVEYISTEGKVLDSFVLKKEKMVVK